MPTLPTQSFGTIVNNTIVGMQGRAAALINFATGSTLRAIAEAFAGLFLWFQALVLQLLLATRLSTSSGLDVDTFTADFMPALPGSQTTLLPGGSPRLGAQYASGQALFARFTASSSAPFIPAASGITQTLAGPQIINAGSMNAATMTTLDQLQSFVVMANPSYPTYSATTGGYTMAAQVSSLLVPVQAIVPGFGGNVAAGSIALPTSPLTGIDTVTNPASFTNGINQESDGQLKARFAAYILGLSRGDIYGLTASIEGAAATIQWTLTESYNLDGSWRPGYFLVVTDDGSGSPSLQFLQTITDAANAVRPLGIQCGVFPPTVIWATVSLQITTAPGYDHPTVAAQVAAIMADNIDGLGLGNGLPTTLAASWAYSVAGVTKVAAVQINSISGDAATLSATKPTQDGLSTIGFATIKSAGVIVS